MSRLGVHGDGYFPNTISILVPPNDPEMHCTTTLIRGVDTPISKVARQGLLTGGQR